MLVDNLMKSIKFPFLESTTIFIFKVRRLASIDPHLSEVEQHHTKSVLPLLLKIQSKYAAARNQKQKKRNLNFVTSRP